MKPSREDLRRNGFSYTVDDSMNARSYEPGDEERPGAIVVGFQAGFNQLLVVVYSYLDRPGDRETIAEEDAIEIAEEYLTEIGWFANDDEDDREIYVYRWAELPETRGDRR